MNFKKKVFLTLNLFFIAVAMYAVYVFFYKTPVDLQDVARNALLKEKKFELKVEEIVLKDGLKVWIAEDHSAPIVALDFYFSSAGYAFDENQKQGLSAMVAALLDEGAGAYEQEAFSNLLEMNAIELNFSSDDENFNVSLTVPSKNLDVAASVLRAVLFEPHFAAENIKVVQKQMAEAVKMSSERPEKVLQKHFKQTFFGQHPKGRDGLGKIEDIMNITRADLLSFVGNHFAKDNLIMAMAGDISKDEAQKFLSDVFSNLPEKSAGLELEKPETFYVFEPQHIQRKMPQVLAHFVLKGTERLADDFYALYMATEIFGGAGLSSRLNMASREKEGLTYGAYVYLNPEKDAPRLEGGFATSFENYEKMEKILFEEFEKMEKDGVSQKEFDAIKNNMLASFNLRFKSVSDISSMLLYMQKENLGMDFLQKRNEYVLNTTRDDVNRAAKKYFAQKPSIITIGESLRKE
ncbi:MAG: insulinase family protein [Alphaproteobacteria bacterium]|nr:insulinase family protein [Alphaproteobacteria bacterium]